MSNKGNASLLTLLLILVTLSGCLVPEDSQISNPPDEEPILGPIDERECFEFDGKERCWLIHIPETATPEFCKENSCPLLIDMHGNSITAQDQLYVSDFSRLTDPENGILIHPEGIDLGWNFGRCCNEENDLGFILTLIDTIIDERYADENRVYLSGWSNGCFMSFEIAAIASEKIAAIACMAGYTDEELPANYSAIPIMEIHGVADQILLYGSGSTAAAIFGNNLDLDEGAIQNFYWWADANDCSGNVPDFEVVEWDYSIKKFTNCANDSEVVLVSLNYAQHNPYLNDYNGTTNPAIELLLAGNPTGIDSSQIAWDFMSQYSKDVVPEE
jgi:polyhydroxybutyrate depolymerase